MREVSDMPDYEKPYFVLFNQITDAISALDTQNFGQARELLVRAQQLGEELVIAQQETDGQ